MISKHDRTRMREEAERVLGGDSAPRDARLTANFVVTLLDHTEATLDSQTRDVPPVGDGWRPWFFWHHVGRYLRSRGWEYDVPGLGWYEPRHGMHARFPVHQALAMQLKRDFDGIGSVDDFATIARRPPWRDEEPGAGGIGARKVRGWLSGERVAL